MKDNLILIVNEKGKLETAPIGLLKANANYTSAITVITPMPLDNVVMANFNKRNSVDWNVSQFLIPSGRKKGKDILDKTHDLYQKVYDWNVFEGIIESKALAYFAKYRADLLYVSIGVGSQQTPELAENYKGVFNYNKPLPETAENGDYYISNGYNFNDQNIKWTLNDIAYYWNGWKKSNYIGTFNTTSVPVPVDPNIPTNIEIVADQDLAVLLAGKIATIEEDIVNLDILTQEHRIRIGNLENDNEVNKTDITDLKLKDQEQDQRLDNIETDIDNITESIKIDNDTLVRENEVIKVSDKLTNQINVNKNDILNIKNTTYTKLETDSKLSDKENKISQFVKDVKYDVANNRLTFEFKVGSNLVVNMTGGGVGGIDLEDVYLEENELVFVFTNEKEVRVPLGSLLVGMASEEWVEYRLNLYAEKADLDALTTDYNTFKQTNENRLNKLDNDIVNINDDISNITASKQDKLVAGANITIDPTTNVISASGGGNGIDLNTLGYMNYAADIYYKERKQSLFANAWEHSLTVNPLEISEDSTSSNPRGIAQYPNGKNEGVIIPQGVTSIGRHAFRDWTSNNQPLVIPNSVTNIGSYAFNGWTSNNQPLIIPNSVTSIGDWSFSYWTSNNQPLIIPNSVTRIGNYAFYNWGQVPYVIVESETPPTLGSSNSFANQNNAPIYVPDSAVDTYKNATNWSNLASRIFPISEK